MLAKNIISNFITRAWLILIYLVSIPYIINNLGADVYGILALTFIITGYFSQLDLGLGGAIIKFVAEYDAKNDYEKLKNIFGTALILYFVLGIIGMILLTLFTKFFLLKIFNIPNRLSGATKIVFYVTSIAFFFKMFQIFFQSFSFGFQRIYEVNKVNIVSQTLKIAFIVLLIYLGYGIVSIAISNSLLTIFQLILLIFLLKRIKQPIFCFSFKKDVAKKLIKYSLQMFSGSFMGTITGQIDKLAIGMFLPLSYLSYYTVPKDASTRINEVTGNIVTAVYPKFGELFGKGSKEEIKKLFLRIIKIIAILTTVVGIFILCFSYDILRIWINGKFAKQSFRALQVFSIGAMVNSVAVLSAFLFNAVNLARYPALLNVFTGILNAILSFSLIPFLGLKGALLAYFVSYGGNSLIMFYLLCKKYLDFNVLKKVVVFYLKTTIISFFFVLPIRFLNIKIISWINFCVIFIGVVFLYLISSYFVILDTKEKEYIRNSLLKLKRGILCIKLV